MELPLKVRVIGQDYVVLPLTPRMSEAADAIGYCDHPNLEIFVRTDLPAQKVAEILTHEIIHCIASAMHSQTESEEEASVDRTARGLVCVIRDNQELFQYIIEALK